MSNDLELIALADNIGNRILSEQSKYPTFFFNKSAVATALVPRKTVIVVVVLVAEHNAYRIIISRDHRQADAVIGPAKTARFFNMPTGEIGKLSQPGGSLYNIEHSNDGLITFPGGLPLKNSKGEIIGAIGVSGSAVENDRLVAEAGASAIS